MDEKRSLGAEVRVTSNAIKNYIDRQMADTLSLEITGVESMIMAFIFRHDKEMMLSSDIMKRFGISKATVSQTISNLIEKGYLVRNVSHSDKRVKYIVLTKKGRDLKKRFDELFLQINLSIVDDFTDEEKEDLYRLLLKIQKNVGFKEGCCYAKKQ